MRTYARGRAYDPNRFGGVTPYHDPNAPEITEVVGPNTVVRKDGRIIRRYRTHTGVISQD